VKNLLIQGPDFWGRILLLKNTVNPVRFYIRNPGINLDPGSTNSSRIALQIITSDDKNQVISDGNIR
jgi:hypothetical protein